MGEVAKNLATVLKGLTRVGKAVRSLKAEAEAAGSFDAAMEFDDALEWIGEASDHMGVATSSIKDGLQRFLQHAKTEGLEKTVEKLKKELEEVEAFVALLFSE